MERKKKSLIAVTSLPGDSNRSSENQLKRLGSEKTES